MVVMFKMATYRGPFCRDCGMAVYKKAQKRTLLTGWWGLISFLVNWLFIFQNLAAHSKVKRLSRPVGSPVGLRRQP